MTDLSHLIRPEDLYLIQRQVKESAQAGPVMELVSKGWRHCYTELFGQTFVDVLAPHHIEAVEWHWDSRLAFLTDEKPEYLAYFPIWPRGHMKSTLAERMIVVDAILSVAYSQPGFALYVGREKDKVRDYIANIEALLSSDTVRKFCPSLSQVAKNDETNQKRQWTATFLHTQAGYVVKGGSIESSQAGARVGDTRPTFIVPDDIDGREDSVVISEMRFKRLTGEILPMRQQNTLVYFAQNLISRYSVMYRIQSGQAKVLTNRKPTKPIKAVLDLVTETREVDGIVKDVVISGESTWQFWDKQRIQDEIDTEGLTAFKIECHPAGTMIRRGYSIVPIEELKVGDSVETHLGRSRPVTELLSRLYTGKMVAIRRAGSSDDLLATANHPLYVARRLRTGRGKAHSRLLKYEWASADTMRRRDCLLEPIPAEPERYLDGEIIWTFTPRGIGRPPVGNFEIRATPELCRLLGYYLAEGNVTSSSTSLTFHSDETEYCEDVMRLFERVFAVPTGIRPSNGKSLEISTGSAPVRAFFKWVGTGSKRKTVPDFVFQLSPGLVREVVIGYMRGDGCKDPSGFAYNTTSEQLAEQMRLLLLRLGVVAATYRLRPRTVTLPQGGTYDRSQHWQGDINGGFATKLGEILGVPHKSQGRNSAFILNGYVHHPIRNVTISDVAEMPVFNMEVADDHSFIANGVASHNCQHEVEFASSGRVISYYDEKRQVITWSQFEAVYGQRQIPTHWQKWVGLDVGYSDGTYPHYSAWTFIATAGMNSQRPNKIFIYRSMFFRGVAIDDQAEAVKREMWSDEEVSMWKLSHERTGEMLTLNQKHELPFSKFTYYQPEDGVAQWQHYSRPIKNQPNTFHEDELIDGEYRIGDCQLFYIVDDDQLVEPKNDKGHANLRRQISNWEFVPVKLTESGQTIQKPSKKDEDGCDSVKGLMAYFQPYATELSKEERFLEKMPEEYKNPESDQQKIARHLWMQKQFKEEQVRESQSRTMGSSLDRFSKLRGR